MRINNKIKTTLVEIAHKSVEYNNEPDGQRKYIRKMLRFYKKNLSEEEQVFLLNRLLEQLSYRSIVIDEESILIINNGQIRKYVSIFVLCVAGMFIGYFLYIDDTIIQNTLNMFYNLAEILRIN